MTDKELYKYAYNFLHSFDNLSKEELELHLRAEYEKPKDLKIIYKKLCESAQNKQMSSKVIGNSIGGIENLGKVLSDFNPHKVAQEFNTNEAIKLLSEIKIRLKPNGQIRTTTRSLWPQFCQSVIDSAHFLKSFETAEKFYKWADFFANDTKAKPALPLMISIEISGIGFPLACDFLKELGFVEYGKPDVHLKDIFKALKIIDPYEKSVIKQDYATLKAIDRIAKENEVTAYAVDKVFWLIGSGNFYLTGKNIGRQKQRFIDEIKKHYPQQGV
jgi:thermostable 8-oxoguanine DNA glycosylase